MGIWSSTRTSEERWRGAVTPVEGAAISRVRKDLFQKFDRRWDRYSTTTLTTTQGEGGKEGGEDNAKGPETRKRQPPNLRASRQLPRNDSSVGFSKQRAERSRRRKEAASPKAKKRNENICKRTLCRAPSSSLETARAPVALFYRFEEVFVTLPSAEPFSD